MSYTQWRRTPYGIKHRLLGVWINDRLGYWRTCKDARCRRARSCQDYECYWRRLQDLPYEEAMRLRKVVEPWTEPLQLGSRKGAHGLRPYAIG
jgi:hypothetical protein